MNRKTFEQYNITPNGIKRYKKGDMVTLRPFALKYWSELLDIEIPDDAKFVVVDTLGYRVKLKETTTGKVNWFTIGAVN